MRWQSIIGSYGRRSLVVVSWTRKSTGEEVAIETADLAPLEGEGNRLSPEELGLRAKSLAKASNPIEAARIKERLTWGFYGN